MKTPRPKKTAPRNVPDCGNGYRWLSIGETVPASAQMKSISGHWFKTGFPGEVCNGKYQYRVKIERPVKPATAAKGKKTRARVMWQIATVGESEILLRDSPLSHRPCPCVAVIPLDDIDGLLHRAQSAYDINSGVGLYDQMRAALRAIGIPVGAVKGSK